MENLLFLGVPILKHIRVFYVMSKALAGELSCTWTGLIWKPYFQFSSFSVSKDWNNAEKPSPRLCTKCRIYFKKYGEDRPLDGDFPYFQPVKDEELPNGNHTMLTRQRNSVSAIFDSLELTIIIQCLIG